MHLVNGVDFGQRLGDLDGEWIETIHNGPPTRQMASTSASPGLVLAMNWAVVGHWPCLMT